MSEYQICTRCIMDTTDPNIIFDTGGVCNHCHTYDTLVERLGYKGAQSDEQLQALVARIKEENKHKEYDCILGISGGVDSSYLAYLSHKFGLRVLAVHVDAGWNTEIAEENIQKVCTKLNLDLRTIVVDWPTIKELQRAYMFSGLPNLDVPQDHVFVAAMYKYAHKYKIRYMLHGGNLATEGILPASWGYNSVDWKNIKSIYRKHGRGIKLDMYPHIGIFEYIWLQSKVTSIRLLNYTPYSKKEAIETLSTEFDWAYYGGKHFESRFTKFFQGYYQPVKFGFDKRRAHLSSLVVGGEMTRDQALKDMADDKGYSAQEQMEDRDHILQKLDISLDEWDRIMSGPIQTEDAYASNKSLFEFLVMLKRIVKG